jgi:hypothetical protein
MGVFDADTEYDMVAENLQEFFATSSEEDEHKMVTALCNIIMVSAGAIHRLGYEPKEALKEAVKEVGSLYDTAYEENFDDTQEEYEADFTNAL